MDGQEEVQLLPNQVCVATENFTANEPGDLSFMTSEKITIIRESEMMFWYIAKNEKGEIGTVPGTYLEPSGPPPIPSKPQLSKGPSNSSFEEDYQRMKPGTEIPAIPPKPVKPPQQRQRVALTDEERKMLILMERERIRRLCKGTLVVATATYRSHTRGDLSFRLHDEMVIIEPMKDLCWYMAKKADNPSEQGIIPLTHVRLVYMSDGEEEEGSYQTPTQPGHERIYEDKNDFISNSGWFSHAGIPLGREAQYHCFARKADISHDKLMSIKKALYLLKYMNEKTYIGKAEILHEELVRHFECFGKRRKDIREIDDDLCHHTYAGGWKLQVWPLEDDQDLEVEFAKKVVEYDSLMSSDGGINEGMEFTDSSSFDKFWEWLSPN